MYVLILPPQAHVILGQLIPPLVPGMGLDWQVLSTCLHPNKMIGSLVIMWSKPIQSEELGDSFLEWDFFLFSKYTRNM